jgi:transcriptional regulator with XRE-family HTH domain
MFCVSSLLSARGGEVKMVYEQGFGEFLEKKRLEKGLTVRRTAENIGLSAGYYSDIEQGRRYPPGKDILERIIAVFNLSKAEQETFFDLAGIAKSEIAPDLPDYIMEHDYVRTALRVARDKASEDDWLRFMQELG